MYDFRISQNEVLADLLAANDEARIADIMTIAETVARNGGVVELWETYSNSPEGNQMLTRFDSLDKVKNWREQINKARSAIGQAPI